MPKMKDHSVRLKAKESTRYKILDAAATIIATSGTSDATTRAVAMKAGVQPPELYRLFGDKDGMLQAVAEHVLNEYVAQKAREPSSGDPVTDLKNGWNTHVEFGRRHPEIFMLIQHGRFSKTPSPALDRGHAALGALIHEIAKVGQLKVNENHAARLIQSCATGTVLTLLSDDPKNRDESLSVEAREAAFSAILTDKKMAKSSSIRQASTHLNAKLDETDDLTEGERLLLGELLARLSSV